MDNKTKIKNIRLKITARFEDNKIENEKHLNICFYKHRIPMKYLRIS